ncbi:MAG: PQQ-binding-like beta-propeller repeat protein [Ktedonobacteraceae bacterium]
MKDREIAGMQAPCREWAESLAAAQRADLSQAEWIALREHLTSCAACAATQVAYREMDALILGLPAVAPLPDLVFEDGGRVPAKSIQKGVVTSMKTIQDRNARQEQEALPWSGEVTVLPGHPRQPPRRVRFGRLVSLSAAVLFVGVLVGSFLLLFAARHPGMGNTPANGAPGRLGDVDTAGPENPNAHVYVNIDSANSIAYELDAKTGAVLWQQRIGHKLTGDPAVADGGVYFPAYDGSVYALRASDGAPLWHTSLGSGAEATNSFPGPNIVAYNGVIYLGTMDGNWYALRTRDGVVLWHKKVLACTHPGPRVVNNNTVVLPTSNPCNVVVLREDQGVIYGFADGFYALRASDGAVIWHDTAHQFNSQSLVVTNGKVYIPVAGGRSGIDVLRVSDGHLLHSLNIQWEDFAAAGHMLYILTEKGDMDAYRISDDSLLWHKQIGAISGQITVGYGMIYVSNSFQGYVVPATVVTSGALQKRNAIAGIPVVLQKRDIIEYTDVWALNTGNGSLRWHWHKSVAEGIARLVLMNNNAYFQTGDGVYAMRASDGKLLWHVLQGRSLQGPTVG